MAAWSVANVDHAGILARAANDPRGFGRQFLQMEARGFIAAMLRPHDREYAEFDHIRLAAHRRQNAVIFFEIEAVLSRRFQG